MRLLDHVVGMHRDIADQQGRHRASGNDGDPFAHAAARTGRQLRSTDAESGGFNVQYYFLELFSIAA